MACRIERLQRAHAKDYRDLMLEAYGREPDAFTSTPEERATLPMSRWEKRLGAQDDAVAFGAFEVPGLVGAIILERGERAKTRHKGHIVGMYVRDMHRGRGLGAALFGAAMDAARADGGFRVITLTVSEGNAGAQALYERFGFRAFGTEPFAIETGGRFIGKVYMACVLQAHPTEESHGE